MRNERGITLVELLAALALAGIVTALVASVLSTGTSSSTRVKTNQLLQHEGNYIVEVIRSEYLKSTNSLIKLEITGDAPNQTLLMNEKPISQGYEYISDNFPDNQQILDPAQNEAFEMIIRDEGGLQFEIKTTFSKLR